MTRGVGWGHGCTNKSINVSKTQLMFQWSLKLSKSVIITSVKLVSIKKVKGIFSKLFFLLRFPLNCRHSTYRDRDADRKGLRRYATTPTPLFPQLFWGGSVAPIAYSSALKSVHKNTQIESINKNEKNIAKGGNGCKMSTAVLACIQCRTVFQPLVYIMNMVI